MLSGWSAGRKVRSPVELAVEFIRSLEMTTNLDRLTQGLGVIGQSLFHPPNVKGWDGGRAWINSSTLIGRSNLLVDLLQDAKTRFAGKDLNQWVKQQGITTTQAWGRALEESLLAVPLSDTERSSWENSINETAGWKEMLVRLSQNPKLHLS
jgi:uncharacterized protein (DUF1800 family)